jgi:hypothetical protein
VPAGLPSENGLASPIYGIAASVPKPAFQVHHLKGVNMAKGQLKSGHEKKKPKQDKSASQKSVSAYQQSKTSDGSAPSAFGKKK